MIAHDKDRDWRTPPCSPLRRGLSLAGPYPAPPPTARTNKPAGTPERETLELAAAGAARVLGPGHGVTKALARAAITMAKPDLWRARRGFSFC